MRTVCFTTFVRAGFLAACAGACLPVFAQEPAHSATTPAAPAPAGVQATRGDYRVGPGDLLSIGVSGLKEFDVRTRVSNSGKIHLPYLGIVRVTDLTTTALQAELATMLRERGLVKEPWVTVRVDQYRAQPVYILGEVMLPGQFVIKDDMYLVDLISLGGGFNEFATPVGYLYRRKENADDLPKGAMPTDEAVEIDFQALNEGRRPELNVKLRGGDVLYVPQRKKEYFFVVGDVVAPGPFELASDAPTLMLSQAFSKAGGPLKTAKISKGVLVRFDRNGGREELPVDFKAILEGRKPDLPVQANDILFIPGSTAKTLGLGMLGIIPGTITSRARR